ncbi:hypothetical protein OG21DRAFT_153946 [Imleria badia]|nr:hypothetical protein OG21DRAFT_153946 [Imleria badia]
MITSVAQYQPGHCKGLKPEIINLAKKRKSPVGSAAVEALVALNVPLPHGIHFSSILCYLDNALPRLDAETGSTSLPNDTDDLPPVLQVNGSERLDDKVVRKLIQTIERDIRQRTIATLTLLKLCNNPIIRDFCSRDKVLDIFIKQLERKETSLLAAYALKTCSRLARHVDIG